MFTNYEISKKIILDRDKLFTLTFFNKVKKVLKIERELLTIFYS